MLDSKLLDKLKFTVRIRVTAERIELFENLGLPVDSYGVGSSLFKERIDVTADVVMVDGEPCAKIGRKAGNFVRLQTVS